MAEKDIIVSCSAGNNNRNAILIIYIKSTRFKKRVPFPSILIREEVDKMSIDSIAVQAVPRRQLQRSNGTASVLGNTFDGYNLRIINGHEAPADFVEQLYVKAFKEAVESAPKQTTRIAESHTPFDLYVLAQNKATGKTIRLHAKSMGIGSYTARVEVYQGDEFKPLNWLKEKTMPFSDGMTMREQLAAAKQSNTNASNIVVGQYKKLREYLTDCLK